MKWVCLFKPKGCLTTCADDRATDKGGARRTVLDLVPGSRRARLLPVGRLDRNTSGVRRSLQLESACRQPASHSSVQFTVRI